MKVRLVQEIEDSATMQSCLRAACRMRSRAILRADFIAGLISLLGATPCVAQPEVIRCLLPEVPITNLSDAVLSEYRAEIAAEFEAYFTAVRIHIACLDSERNRALSEAHRATEAYSTFLNAPPTKKGPP